MKYLQLAGLLFKAASVFAQDNSKQDKKAWLGVLTLAEKYKNEKNWSPADQAITGEHFQRLVKYKNEGVVVLAGRTELPLDNPDMIGLVVFYAKDEKDALQFMFDDPAVKNKIMLAKVHPY